MTIRTHNIFFHKKNAILFFLNLNKHSTEGNKSMRNNLDNEEVQCNKKENFKHAFLIKTGPIILNQLSAPKPTSQIQKTQMPKSHKTHYKQSPHNKSIDTTIITANKISRHSLNKKNTNNPTLRNKEKKRKKKKRIYL